MGDGGLIYETCPFHHKKSYQKEMNVLTKDQENTFLDAKAPESSLKTPSQMSAEDISEIQKIK